MKAAHSAVLTVSRSHAASPAKPDSVPARHSHALGVYTINLQELLNPTFSLSKVPHVGWRYLWGQTRDCPSVEVTRVLQSKRDVATARSSGPVNKRLIRALERAAKKTGSTHVVRLLSAPPLVDLAVWLKSFRHRADKVIVVETIVPTIQVLKIYAVGEFFNLLRPEAATLIEHTQNIKPINKASWSRTPS